MAAVGATNRGKGPPQSSGAQHQVLGTSLTVQDSPVSLPSLLLFPLEVHSRVEPGEKGTVVLLAGAKMVVESTVKTWTRQKKGKRRQRSGIRTGQRLGEGGERSNWKGLCFWGQVNVDYKTHGPQPSNCNIWHKQFVVHRSIGIDPSSRSRLTGRAIQGTRVSGVGGLLEL